MPHFIRPYRWSTQPRGQVGLNLGSELFSGPVWAVYNGGEIINAINYRSGAVAMSGRNRLWGHTATNAIGVGCDLPQNAASTLSWTLAIVVTPLAAGASATPNGNDAFVGVTEAFNNATFDRTIGYSQAGVFFGYEFDGAAKYNTATEAVTLSDGPWCVAASSSGSQLRMMQARLGGQSFHAPAATAVSNAGFTGYTTPFFAVGDNSNSTNAWQHHVAFAAYLYGAWTPERFAAWAENPWQVFQVRRPVIYSFGQSAGSTTLTVTPAAITLVGQTVDLEVQISLDAAQLTLVGQTVGMTLSATAPTIVTYPIDSLRVGVAFSQQFVATGDAPITWAVGAGLPPGLSLSSTGLLSGTPTAAGAYAFTVTATNVTGSDDQSYIVSIGRGTVALRAVAATPRPVVPARVAVPTRIWL